MFTSSVLTSFAALLCFGLAQVDARIVRRDVISPPITYPKVGTIWTVNERHNVTWDTSGIPPGTTSAGMIVLGFLDDADGANEHLDLAHPLASGFPITMGRVEITVPTVTTRSTYILVLFGDSGNASGKFTIKNIIIGAPSSSSAGPAATTPSPASSSAGSADGGGGVPASTNDAASAAPTPALPTPAASPMASDVAATLPSSAAASFGPGLVSAPSPAAQTAPAAQSVAPSTAPNPFTSAGLRTASIGGAATTWLLTMCSVAVAIGFAL